MQLVALTRAWLRTSQCVAANYQPPLHHHAMQFFYQFLATTTLAEPLFKVDVPLIMYRCVGGSVCSLVSEHLIRYVQIRT